MEASNNKLGNLPIPFNIPNVLHALLFEDIGIEFSPKQQDLLEMLRFSYTSLENLKNTTAKLESSLNEKLLQNPDDPKVKQELETLRLEFYQANYDFKEMVGVLGELLEREQFQKLLSYCNIPT